MIKIYRLFIFTAFILLISCAGNRKKSDNIQKIYTFGSSTEKSLKSDDKIDNNTTYQMLFSLEKNTDCITIEIESVYLQKSFPVQKIPKKTFFIVEKEVKLNYKSLKNNTRFVQIGRNFNNEWELFTPVKICTIKNDPLSILDNSMYRIRFTTFEKLPVYYVITISSDSNITFIENTGKK